MEVKISLGMKTKVNVVITPYYLKVLDVCLQVSLDVAKLHY